MFDQRPNKILPSLIINIVITFLSLGALFITIWFSTISYPSFVNFVTQTLERPDLKPLIVKSLFPYEKYQVIYKFHWAFGEEVEKVICLCPFE